METTMHLRGNRRFGGRLRLAMAAGAALVAAGAALVAALPLVAAAPASAAPAPGTRLWARTYEATVNSEEFYGCAKGPNGGVYATGVRNSAPGGFGDLVVCKYASSGSRRWVRTWVSPWFSPSHGTDIAVDRNGNFVVAGEVNNPPGTDWLITRWTPDGTLLWGIEYDGPAGGGDELIDLVLDRDGNPYACGYVTVPGGTAMMTVKFRRGNGSVAWQSIYVGPGANDGAASIVIDSQRNTYMAGWSTGTLGDSDGVIVKTDAAGHRVWVRREDTGAHAYNDWNDLSLRNGVLYAAGEDDASPAPDIVVGAYTTANQRKWVRTWDDPGHFTTEWEGGIALDGAGNVLVCGTINSGGVPNQIGFLVKWNSHGARQWFRTYKNGTRYANYDEVVADSDGNAWVVGTVDTLAGHDDALLAKYSAGGTRRWLRKWDDGASGGDSLWTGMLSGSTSLYAVGQTDLSPGNHTGLVLKYRR